MKLRLILAAIVVLAGGLCGRSLAWSPARRYRLILELMDALKMLKIQMVDLLEPVDRALVRSGTPTFAAIAGAIGKSGGVEAAWKSVCARERARGGRLDCLTDHDCELLDRLFEQLGQSGRSGQEQVLDACMAALERSQADARERSGRISKLYPAIGLLGGLAVVVVMI